jgi:protein SCO1/2
LKKSLVLFLILLFPSVAYLLLTTGKHNIKKLEYFGTKIPGDNGKDTIYHAIPEFNFTDQNGQPFGSADLSNKIYVANFFFTNCPSICPRMQTLMKKVQDEDDFKKLSDFELVSFTVDPDRDTQEKLKEFSTRIQADDSRWHFLTGDRAKLYQLASSGFMLSAMEDSTAAGGFLHSDVMVLVDRNKHIRGLYEGTSLKDVKRLIDEIKVLIAEYNAAKKSNKNPVR